MSVLDVLLEGFAEEVHPRGWHGRFRKGDKVRVELKGGKSIVGRVVRPADAQPDSHAVIQPENGGPHVLAKLDAMKLDTPERSAREHAKRQLEQGQRIAGGGRVVHAAADAARTRAEILAKSPGAQRDLERHNAIGRGARRLHESVNPLDRLLEAFGAGAPPETPAQSQVLGAQQVAKAQASIRAGWNASKHPRGRGGKFGYTTGGRRAKRGSRSSSRTLGVGARGALVGSIQRQLGISADGKYGPQTRSAVARYQQQHHLQVDGVVGRQTLAALRGHTNPQRVKPGPIAAKTATLKQHPATKKPGKPPAPVRIGGGIVVA